MLDRTEIFEEMLDKTHAEIKNEKIWALGATDAASTKMHLDNIERLIEKTVDLAMLKNAYEKFDNISANNNIDEKFKTDVIEKLKTLLEEEKTARTEYVDFLEILLKEFKPAIRTRQDAFMEYYPNAALDEYGSLDFCPKKIDKTIKCCLRNRCDWCKKGYWHEEIKEQ